MGEGTIRIDLEVVSAAKRSANGTALLHAVYKLHQSSQILLFRDGAWDQKTDFAFQLQAKSKVRDFSLANLLLAYLVSLSRREVGLTIFAQHFQQGFDVLLGSPVILPFFYTCYLSRLFWQEGPHCLPLFHLTQIKIRKKNKLTRVPFRSNKANSAETFVETLKNSLNFPVFLLLLNFEKCCNVSNAFKMVHKITVRLI